MVENFFEFKTPPLLTMKSGTTDEQKLSENSVELVRVAGRHSTIDKPQNTQALFHLAFANIYEAIVKLSECT